MARDGIRLDTRRFDQMMRIYPENLQRAGRNALIKAGKAAVAEMRSVVVTAPNTTKGPGRVRSSFMLESLTIDGSIVTAVTKAGTLQIRFGFIDGPYYARFQERGTSRGIIPMLAITQGRIVFEIVMKQELKKEARAAGQKAMALKYLKEEQALKKRLNKSRIEGGRTSAIRAAQNRRTR